MGQLVRYREIEPQSWRNGRGVTRVIAAADDGSWRMSIAEITGRQPYSAFPGVDRAQLSLGPGDVRMTIAGVDRVVAPGEVVTFAGEDAVEAEPDEPGFLDLNLMARRSERTLDLRIVTASIPLATADVRILIALEAGAVDGEAFERLDAMSLEADARPRIEGLFALATLGKRST